MVIHEPCVHNEWRSLTERHLALCNVPQRAYLRKMRRMAKIIAGRLMAMNGGQFVRWEPATVVACYDGAKKKLYQDALDSIIREGPVMRRDAKIKAFVKAEKRSYDNPKVPRLIQHRSTRYTLEMLRYVKPVECVYYNMKRQYKSSYHKSRVFAKHLNLHERALLIREKFDAMPDCCVVSADCSGFDAHVHADVLAIEHGIYMRLFGGDPELQRLLSMQMDNSGRTVTGIDYKCRGRRMSGDANTSLGCHLVVQIIVELCCEHLVGPKDYLVDGDDVLFFMSRKHYDANAAIIERVFNGCGQKAIAMPPVTEYQDIVYGRAKPVLGHGGWRLGRDPYAVMGTAFVSHKHFQEPKGGLAALRTLAQGLLITNLGVPVLQAFAEGVLRSTPQTKWNASVYDPYMLASLQAEVRGQLWTSVQPEPITPEARRAYERAWNIAPTEQVRLETMLARYQPWLADMRFIDGGDLWLADSAGIGVCVDTPK